MPSRLTEPVRGRQGEGNLVMQRAALGRIQGGVNALLDQRMAHLVSRITVAIAQHNEPSIHQPHHCRGHRRGRMRRLELAQLLQVRRTPHDGHQIEHGLAVLVQRLYPFSDAGRQRLRDSREPRCREVDTGVEYGVEQADCEQRVTLRLPKQPRSQAWWRRWPSEYPLGQLTHIGLLESLQVETRQHAVLLEPEQHVFAHGAFDHLAEASAHQHKHSVVDHGVSDVIQRLPRRSVSKMHVVEEHDDRLFSCEVRKHNGQCFTNMGRRDVQPPRSVKPGRSPKNAAEVGDISAAQAHHLVVGAMPQVAVEELSPQSKR
jgi:hypothetical protein